MSIAIETKCEWKYYWDGIFLDAVTGQKINYHRRQETMGLLSLLWQRDTKSRPRQKRNGRMKLPSHETVVKVRAKVASYGEAPACYWCHWLYQDHSHLTCQYHECRVNKLCVCDDFERIATGANY